MADYPDPSAPTAAGVAPTTAVDRHDLPEAMRQIVILRDPHCVFPWCRRDSRGCDLDHIETYTYGDDPADGDEPDGPGPPGQTSPENLGPLCRRHHRVKTSGKWRYVRTSDGHYLWTGPHHHRYLVTPDDTYDL